VKKFLPFLVLLCSVGFSQSTNQPTIHVTELPPESIPVGTCKDDLSGYLYVPKDGKENNRLTDKQIGEYVRVRLNQGYKVLLYPQISGKIYAIAVCASTNR
jgi:hypothetical protein